MGNRSLDLRELASRLGTASSNEETAFFHEAARALTGSLPADKDLSRLIDLGAVHDAAVCLFRCSLPAFGFQFGQPPPLSDGTPAGPLAIVWRRGDRTGVPYRAATPALALLAAAIGETASLRKSNARAACDHCFGAGWTVTGANGKVICQRCRS